MSKQETIIRLEGIALRYRNPAHFFSKVKRDFWALQDVSFSIYKGEKLGVIGRNGSGKSTLMRILAGVYKVDRGRVELANKKIRIQLLTLGVGFEGSLTGRENALLNGILMGKSRNHMLARLEEIKEFSELGVFFEKPVYTYSSGMNARLGFAVAMEIDPEVLLIDEVLGVGDSNFARKSHEAITRKFNSDQTVVLISHDSSTIRELCERAVWIENGVIKATGPAIEISKSYEEFLLSQG